VVGIMLSLVFGGLGGSRCRSKQRFEFTQQGAVPVSAPNRLLVFTGTAGR